MHLCSHHLFIYLNFPVDSTMGLTDFYKLEKDQEKVVDAFSSELDHEAGHNDLINLDQNKKEIGYFSATFLMLNRMIGAGVFSTGSTIFILSGSVGTSLLMWAAGTIIAFSGLLVYMELGLALPRNGGEKTYLEYIFRKPKYMITATYSAYAFLLGWCSGNSILFGEAILNAAGVEVTQWNSRGIGVGVVTFALLVNGIHIKTGLFIANGLGVIKIVIILFITVAGWVALGGGIRKHDFVDPHNFRDAFAGKSPSGFGVVNALYNVIWSYVGYSNANYALAEIKNPVKVLRVAAPTAFISLGIIYMFVNIAYFAVVPKEEIAGSGRLLAASFFKYAFSDAGEKAASVFIGLSALGNVLSVLFSQGRIVQQLGREGCLPFSLFFASSKPFGTPLAGLFEHWCMCIIIILAPPPGDAYNFVLNLISYPLNIINTLISVGLLWVYWQKRQGKMEWNPPIRATIPVIAFFFLVSLYLVVAPYIPPTDGEEVYKDMPYWIHPVVTWGIFAIGFAYWVLWTQILPRIGGYQLVSKEVLGEDGFWRNKFYHVKKGEDGFIEEEQTAPVEPVRLVEPSFTHLVSRGSKD